MMFLGYINRFRAIAIIFIVAGHSIAAFSWDGELELKKVFDLVVSNGTVLFVFIAGYLFQHLSPKFAYRKYLISKLKNVLLPYILVSIPAIILFTTYVDRAEKVWPTFYDNPVWLQVVYFYVTGAHLTPMWFIPMITLFYLISPLLILLDKSRWFYYFLPLFFGLTFIYDRGYLHLSFIHFFSIYVFGMWCSKYKEKINPMLNKMSVLLLLAVLSVTMLLVEYYYLRIGHQINTFQKLVLTLFIMGLFIRLGSKGENKILSLLANFSFGIYFVHAYALFLMKVIVAKFQDSFIIGQAGPYYVAVCVATLALSIFVILMVKRIWGDKSRYLVGC